MTERHRDIDILIRRSLEGDRESSDRLIRLVYNELRQRIHGQRISRHGPRTIHSTALVHEAYGRLLGNRVDSFNGRKHFMATASTAVRRILVEYARKASDRKTDVDMSKARGDWEPGDGLSPGLASDLLNLDQALERLEQIFPELVRVVECRAFTGMTVEDTATVLRVDAATVERRWDMAKSWLHYELSLGDGRSG